MEAVQIFLKTCRSEETRKQYEILIQKYIEFVGEDNIFCDNNPRLIEAKIIEFILALRYQGKSYYAIRNYVQAIKSFYKINDIVLNGYKISKYMPELMKVSRDRAYAHEEIGRMLSIADERMKVTILLLASTGIRIGAIPNIKCKHISNNRLTVYEGFTEEYTTFVTQETLDSIKEYLAFRNRYGEKVTAESWLIRDQFDLRNPGKPQKAADSTLQWNLRTLAIKCGIRKNGQKYTRQEIMIAHGFRKFFTTQLVKSKVNPEIREMLLGHKIGLASCYYRPTEQEMYAEYEKAIDNLTINEENRLKRKVEHYESDDYSLELTDKIIKHLKKQGVIKN